MMYVVVGLIAFLLGFIFGVPATLKAYHVGYYDIDNDELFFERGKEPINLGDQKYGVVDILHVTKVRRHNGHLS